MAKFRPARRKPAGFEDRRVGIVIRARQGASEAEVLAQAALAFATGRAKVSKPVGRPARGAKIALWRTK